MRILFIEGIPINITMVILAEKDDEYRGSLSFFILYLSVLLTPQTAHTLL